MQAQQQEQQAQKIINQCYAQQSNSLYIGQGYQKTSIRLLRKVFEILNCHTLKRITLEKMEIKNKLIDVMLEFQFSKLEQIYLQESKVGDQGVRKFVSGDWPALKIVNICKNEIRDSGLAILLSKPPNKMVELNLRNNEISQP